MERVFGTRIAVRNLASTTTDPETIVAQEKETPPFDWTPYIDPEILKGHKMPTEKIYYTSIITYKEHPQYGHPIDAKHVMSYMTRAPSQELAKLDAIVEGLLQGILQERTKYEAQSWEIPEKDIAGMGGIEFDRAYTMEELRQHGYKTIREYADDAELN